MPRHPSTRTPPYSISAPEVHVTEPLRRRCARSAHQRTGGARSPSPTVVICAVPVPPAAAIGAGEGRSTDCASHNGGLRELPTPLMSAIVRDRLKRAVKYLVSRLVPASVQRQVFGKVFSVPTLLASVRDMYPADPILGDHYYSRLEYRAMFTQHGFRATRLSPDRGPFQSFVLVCDTRDSRRLAETSHVDQECS